MAMILMLTLVSNVGCKRNASIGASGTKSVPQPASQPPAIPNHSSDLLLEARNRAQLGQYAEAITDYNKVLAQANRREHVEAAIFQLALLYANPNNPIQDLEKSQSYLKRLLSEHPDGSYLAEAQTLSSLIEELNQTRRDLNGLRKTNQSQDQTIKKLQQELDRLKAIDLKMKKRKGD